jgi:hypothetical protein
LNPELNIDKDNGKQQRKKEYKSKFKAIAGSVTNSLQSISTKANLVM